MKATKTHSWIEQLPKELKRGRLSFWRDGLGLAVVPPFFLGGAMAGQLWGWWHVALPIANILTIAFTSLTVIGVIAAKWESDIAKTIDEYVDAHPAGGRAVAGTDVASRPWWRFWRPRAAEAVASVPQVLSPEQSAIVELRRHNLRFSVRAHDFTFLMLMLAVVSGGLAIAGEIGELA